MHEHADACVQKHTFTYMHRTHTYMCAHGCACAHMHPQAHFSKLPPPEPQAAGWSLWLVPSPCFLPASGQRLTRASAPPKQGTEPQVTRRGSSGRLSEARWALRTSLSGPAEDLGVFCSATYQEGVPARVTGPPCASVSLCRAGITGLLWVLPTASSSPSCCSGPDAELAGKGP